MSRSMGARYTRDGFTIARRVVDNRTVDELRAALVCLEVERSPTPQILYTHAVPIAKPPSLTTLLMQWRNVWQALDADLGGRLLEAVADTVAEVAGYEPVPFQDVFIRKDRHQREFPWHQDLAYWPVDREDGVVAWVAMDPIDKTNGGVELSLGSHRGHVGPSIDLHSGLPQLGTNGQLQRPAKGQVPDLAAGDVLVFHARCWHRSGENHSGAQRRAWAVSFVHPDTRWWFSRTPRHAVTSVVEDGQEVRRWSSDRYHRALG